MTSTFSTLFSSHQHTEVIDPQKMSDIFEYFLEIDTINELN